MVLVPIRQHDLFCPVTLKKTNLSAKKRMQLATSVHSVCVAKQKITHKICAEQILFYVRLELSSSKLCVKCRPRHDLSVWVAWSWVRVNIQEILKIHDQNRTKCVSKNWQKQKTTETSAMKKRLCIQWWRKDWATPSLQIYTRDWYQDNPSSNLWQDPSAQCQCIHLAQNRW